MQNRLANKTTLSTRAFTLLELLVVVTIMVVLIAILVPALDKAIGLAEEAKCKVNLRNTYQGFVGFSLDHRGNLPGSYITFWDHRGSWAGTEVGYEGKLQESQAFSDFDEWVGQGDGNYSGYGNEQEWAAHAGQPRPIGTVAPYVGVGTATKGLYLCPSAYPTRPLTPDEIAVQHAKEALASAAGPNISNGRYDYNFPAIFSGTRLNAFHPTAKGTDFNGQIKTFSLPMILEGRGYITDPGLGHRQMGTHHRDFGTMYVAFDGSLSLYHHQREESDFGVHGPSALHNASGKRVPMGFISRYGRYR